MEEKIKEILTKCLWIKTQDGSFGNDSSIAGVDEATKELSSLLQPKQEVSEDEIYKIGYSTVYSEMPAFGRDVNVERLKCFIEGFKKCQQLQASDAVLFVNWLRETEQFAYDPIKCLWVNGLYDGVKETQKHYTDQDLYSGPFQEYKRKKKEG